MHGDEDLADELAAVTDRLGVVSCERHGVLAVEGGVDRFAASPAVGRSMTAQEVLVRGATLQGCLLSTIGAMAFAVSNAGHVHPQGAGYRQPRSTVTIPI